MSGSTLPWTWHRSIWPSTPPRPPRGPRTGPGGGVEADLDAQGREMAHLGQGADVHWDPASRIPMRASTSLRMWEDKNTLWPRALASWTAWRNACSMSGSSPLVGLSQDERVGPGHERRHQHELLAVPLGVDSDPPVEIEPEPSTSSSRWAGSRRPSTRPKRCWVSRPVSTGHRLAPRRGRPADGGPPRSRARRRGRTPRPGRRSGGSARGGARWWWSSRRRSVRGSPGPHLRPPRGRGPSGRRPCRSAWPSARF